MASYSTHQISPRFICYVSDKGVAPFQRFGFSLFVGSHCPISVIQRGIQHMRPHQTSRERPVSGHGQVRESVENGGGRPARYALARRRVVIFFR
jgi:hypothetical protein